MILRCAVTPQPLTFIKRENVSSICIGFHLFHLYINEAICYKGRQGRTILPLSQVPSFL